MNNINTRLNRLDFLRAIGAIFIVSHSHALIRKLFKVCGDASYSIYLFHMFPLMIISGLWKRELLISPTFMPPIITLLTLILIGVLGGVIAYLLFEKPIFNFLKRKIILKNNKGVSTVI